MVSCLGVLILALASKAPSCVTVEVTAVGPNAHGATVARHSAPHQLIRALDLLPRWTARTGAVKRATIVALAGADAINVIPARATARVELDHSSEPSDWDAELGELTKTLGKAVTVEHLDLPCAAANEPGV